MITADSSFKAPPRISERQFLAVLRSTGSLASDALWDGYAAGSAREDAARAIYRLIVSQGHDPAVQLAILGKESSFGTNRDSVLWRNTTRSWTNARSVRAPSLKATATIITDAVRKSQYVKYASVIDSVHDGLFRVDEPGFAYRNANAVSIVEHIRVWAPSNDANKPEQYAATMAGWINGWIASDPGEEEPPMAAQIPGFLWEPAASTHFKLGRTKKISGGAQHYTAGTNSLAWLTRTSGMNPPNPEKRVSATFLVKHNPTLADRGWQLVKIEDTAWTTGSFVNPMTVSIEYEHTQNQSIPDIAYEVLAQTWINADAYVKAKGLGEIGFNVKGHREWTGNASTVCPDGIDVARIVRRMRELSTGGGSSDPLSPDPSVPDPRGAANPWGRFWIPVDLLTAIDSAIAAGGFLSVGYVIGGAMVEDDKLVVYTERARFERNRDGSITRGLVGLEAMNARKAA